MSDGRYVLDDEAVRATIRHYGVWDNATDDYVRIGGQYAYGLTLAEAREVLARLTEPDEIRASFPAQRHIVRPFERTCRCDMHSRPWRLHTRFCNTQYALEFRMAWLAARVKLSEHLGC